MKIVILDPYFETLGGGEKVAVVMAEHLAKTHQVIILVKHPVDKKMVGAYFNVDLARVDFQLLPRESFFVRALTSRYAKLPGRWKSIIFDRASLQALRKIGSDLFINSLYQSSLPSPAPISIYMCMFPQKLEFDYRHLSPMRKAYNQITKVMENKAVGSRRQAVNSYTTVIANSNYTAGWIKKYWGRDAKIMYPVCDDMGPPAAKKPIILNVGRFFADNGSSHHKRQDELLKAFIRLGHDDWQLHLAGSITPDKESLAYMAKLHKLAKGHDNIFIHPNMPFEDIRKLWRAATIYWHATGYGYDAELFPENQEHFGMVTVEAMSAGLVPIVYNSAGQAEVVQDGKNGFLWNSIDELLADTRKVMDDAGLYEKIAKEAMQRAHEFDRRAFLSRLDKIISQLGK